LRQTVELYDAINLFAFTDPEKTLENLAALLNRSLAPKGCILFKYGEQDSLRYVAGSGIDRETELGLLLQLRQWIKTNDSLTSQGKLLFSGRIFAIFPL